jgi:hypothetical protein
MGDGQFPERRFVDYRKEAPPFAPSGRRCRFDYVVGPRKAEREYNCDRTVSTIGFLSPHPFGDRHATLIVSGRLGDAINHQNRHGHSAAFKTQSKLFIQGTENGGGSAVDA